MEKYTIDISELGTISSQIYNKYIDLAEYYFMRVTDIEYGEEKFEKELDELKSMILSENVLYDIFYQKLTPVEIDCILNAPEDDDDLILKRIKMKLLAWENDPQIISRQALNNLKNECRIVVSKQEEKEIFYDILNELNSEKFTTDGPEIEIFKNFLVFLSHEIEKTSDEDLARLLIMEFFFSIFSDPRLEEKMVDNKFILDPDFIRVSDAISLDDQEYAQYRSQLEETFKIKISASIAEMLLDDDYYVIEEPKNNLISKIFEFFQSKEEYEEEDKNYLLSIDTLLKCDFRATMYTLSDKQFTNAIDYIKNIIKENKENPRITLLEEAIEETKLDREKFPKIDYYHQNTAFENVEKIIYQLYEKLIVLQERRYNGEDVDSEIGLVINEIKNIRIVEYEELKKELLEDFDKEAAMDEGCFRFHLKSRGETLEARARISELAGIVAGDAMKEIVGYDPFKESFLNSVSLEINKNILFFLEQAIACAEGETREFLIRFKFNFIYSSYELEEDAMQGNFEISKEHLCFPSIIIDDFNEKQEYYKQSKDIVLKKLEVALNEFHQMDKDITPLMEGQIYKAISLLRGLLYTLGDKSFEMYLEALNLSLRQINDSVTFDLVEAVTDLAGVDRKVYQKIIF